MEISLNANQTQVLYLDDSTNIRIEGNAGTGKSIIALYRAVYFSEVYKNKRILLLCFNRDLKEDIESKYNVLKSKFNIKDSKNLHINTVHTESRKYLVGISKLCDSNLVEKLPFTNKGEVVKYFTENRNLIEKTYNTIKQNKEVSEIIDTNVNNIIDEIIWIQSMGVVSREEYREISRVGRNKFRVEKTKRDFIYDIYEEYIKLRNSNLEKSEFQKKIFDFNDIGSYIKNIDYNIDKYLSKDKVIDVENIKYDIIIVDEYQDFSTDLFYAMQTLLKKDGHFELIGDPNQSIFGDRVSWKSIGIDARSMVSYNLSINYRNTFEIYDVAKIFLLENDKNIKVPRRGDKVEIYEFKNLEEESRFIADKARELEKNKKEYVIIYQNGMLVDINNIKKYNKNAIIKSINKIKGLEYDVVILPGISEANFVDNSIDDFEKKKYMNSLYVSMTRAKNNLIITSAGEINNLIKRGV